MELSTEPIDPGDRVTTGCGNHSGSEFVVTGNGGLPPNPNTYLLGETVWLDTRELTGVENRPVSAIDRNGSASGKWELTEARGWAIDPQGQVVLTATVSENAPSPRNWVCADLNDTPRAAR